MRPTKASRQLGALICPSLFSELSSTVMQNLHNHPTPQRNTNDPAYMIGGSNYQITVYQLRFRNFHI